MHILDHMYVCNKAGVMEIERFRNALVSRPLPYLKRSYLSFHHLCGYDETTSDQTPHNCAITVQKEKNQEEEFTSGPDRPTRTIILTVPDSRLSNDGNLARVTEWFFEYRPLPRIDMNERLVLNAEFDAKKGGFGIDNIHFHTPQR